MILKTEGGRLPDRAHAFDAGGDLYASSEYVIPGLTDLLTRQQKLIFRRLDSIERTNSIFRLEEIDFSSIHGDIETELRVAVPPGYVGIVHDKSGLGKRRIKIFGRVIDSGYRGTIRVMVTNFGTEWVVSAGMKVAQLVIYPIELVDFSRDWDGEEETERGVCGFGSTGE